MPARWKAGPSAVEASREQCGAPGPDRCRGRDAPVSPTHWSFGQLCSAGRCADFLSATASRAAGRHQPAAWSCSLAPRRACRRRWRPTTGRLELRAVTGPDYGRIWDHELVAAVMKIAGNGTGDTRWKVPGVLDWATDGPQSVRGRDPGDDDALRRATATFSCFWSTIPIRSRPGGCRTAISRICISGASTAWNSEVGSKTLGIASFYLRAVCHEPQSVGVEDFEEISIRHSSSPRNVSRMRPRPR